MRGRKGVKSRFESCAPHKQQGCCGFMCVGYKPRRLVSPRPPVSRVVTGKDRLCTDSSMAERAFCKRLMRVRLRLGAPLSERGVNMDLYVYDLAKAHDLQNHPKVVIKTQGPIQWRSSCYPDGYECFNGHGSMMDEWLLHRKVLFHKEKQGEFIITIE